MARFTGGGSGGSGVPGPRGPRGYSAYEIAVENGFEGTEQEWLDSLGGGTQEIIPLPEFLTYEEGRLHLPTLNQNFGWDSNGVWFGPTAQVLGEDEYSYPIFTNFTIPQNTSTTVAFDVEVGNECSDAGVAFYVDGTTPIWNFGANPTRIAAQFNCPQPELAGVEGYVTSQDSLPGPGTYRVLVIYTPTSEDNKVAFQISTTGEGSTLLYELNLNEALPEGDYRIGFAADMDPGDGGRTYIKNLLILTGGDEFSDTLTNGNSGSSSTNLANFVFELDNGDGNGSIIRTNDSSSIIIKGGDDLTLQSLGDDVRIWADDDIRFVSNQGGDAEHFWRLNSEGEFWLPGEGRILNPNNSSGDNNGASTLQLIPDNNLGNDQYMIIDPTQPNHIHIRAGGEQDNSNADLILGAERTNVIVSDSSGDVGVASKIPDILHSEVNLNFSSSTTFISTMENNINYGWFVSIDGTNYEVTSVVENSPFEGQKEIQASGVTFNAQQIYNFFTEGGQNNWRFDSDGTLYGPAMNNLQVAGVQSIPDYNLPIGSNAKVVLYGGQGVFLTDGDVATNQIATLGDIGVETSYAVEGGTDGTQPTFTGDPLFTASYVKMSSNLVHFQIQVDMDNITSFGTGQYYMTLPFDAKANYVFRDGCIHDSSNGKQYHISGHVVAGSNQLILFSSVKDGNSVEDVLFTSTFPFTLATDDNFHIAGTYIAQ